MSKIVGYLEELLCSSPAALVLLLLGGPKAVHYAQLALIEARILIAK